MHPTNILVIDSAELPANADFPPPQAARYRWMHYPRVTTDDFIATCSRAGILVSLATPLTAALLAGLPRLKFIIARASAACDLPALAQRGIRLATTASGLDKAGNVCQETVDTIDGYIANHEPKPC